MYFGEFLTGESSCKSKLMNIIKNNYDLHNGIIPGFIFASNKEFIRGVIHGYFNINSNVDDDECVITISSKKKEIIKGMSILLSYFGIFGLISENDSKLYNYNIQGKYINKFTLNIVSENKLNEINKLVSTRRCTIDYIDLIPEINDTLNWIINELNLTCLTMRHSIMRETLGKYIDTFKLENNKLDNLELKHKISNRISILEQAYNGDIVWDEITEIKILDDPKEYVYDLSVPGGDTFMVNAGVLVHNTLNSFHHAGIGNMSHTTLGVPRIKELLSVSKNPKTPQMMIYLQEQYRDSKEMANKIASYIKYTTLGHIRGRLDVFYDPTPYVKNSYMEQDNIDKTFYTRKGNKANCQVEIDNLPWLIRVELSKEKMIEKEVTLSEIKIKFCNWWEKRHIDSKSMKKDERKIFHKITSFAVLSNSDSDKQPVLHIRFNVKDIDKNDVFNTKTLNNFIDIMIDNFKLKGIENVKDINTIVTDRVVTFGNHDYSENENHDYNENNNEEQNIKEEYIIYTSGVNLVDIRYIFGIDLTKTMSDNIIEVYETFGIEVTRTVLLREIINGYQRAGKQINYQHVSILVDLMTANGYIISIDRHGMNKSNADPLGKASFEKTVEQLLTSAIFGNSDNMKGVSARIMAGLVIKGGTGYPNIRVNTKMIQNSEYVEDIHESKQKTIDNGGIASDIITNNKGSKDIFIPTF